MPAENFQDVTTTGSVRNSYSETDAARNDYDLVWFDEEKAKLSLNIQATLLRYYSTIRRYVRLQLSYAVDRTPTN